MAVGIVYLSELQITTVAMAPSNRELDQEDTTWWHRDMQLSNDSPRVRMDTIKSPKTKPPKAPSIISTTFKAPQKVDIPKAPKNPKSHKTPKKLKSPKASKNLK